MGGPGAVNVKDCTSAAIRPRAGVQRVAHTPTWGSGLYRLVLIGAGQVKWRCCRKCEGLFFFGSVNFGRCPAGAVHDPFGSADYVLEQNAQFVPLRKQAGWRWCRKCQGLFFGENLTNGRCPAGGAHDPKQSGDYNLLHP